MPGKSFRGKKVMADMDASDCPKFEAVEAVFDISTIGTAQFAQGAFPIPSSSDIESLVGRFGVARGEQIGEIPEDLAPSKEKEDRLIWEKHEKEQESKKEE
jgi:hypothetical protein